MPTNYERLGDIPAADRERTVTSVTTTSRQQVRRPIHSEAVASCRNCVARLNALAALLD